MIVSLNSEHQIRLVDFATLNVLLSTAAHVGGCTTTALDPRGKYVVYFPLVLREVERVSAAKLSSDRGQ